MTDIDKAELISALQEKVKIQFQTFLKRNSNFWVSMLKYLWRPFHWCINYQCRTDIDKTKVISALQHKSKFNFELKRKYKYIFGFPCWSTCKDLSIDVSITNVGLILMKPGWFVFSRYGVRTDTVLESSYENMSAHKIFFNSKLKIRSLLLIIICINN